MASYLELYNLVSDVDFGKRVHVALWKTSADVIREADTVDQHDIRIALAKKLVMKAVRMPPDLFIMGIIQNAQVFANGSASTDAMIQTATDSAFTTFAQLEARYGA